MEGRKAYIGEVLEKIYTEEKQTIEKKIDEYTSHWVICLPQIEAALSDAFDLDCRELFNDMVCRISLNPVEPRYLQEHSFDLFYLNSGKGAVGEAIHEIIHFVWFHVWNQVFEDDPQEYEAPSLK